MSQENVELVRRIIEVWDSGDYDALNALAEGRAAPDFELHPLYLDRVYTGDEAPRQLGADLAAAWEDYRATTEWFGPSRLPPGRKPSKPSGCGSNPSTRPLT